MYHLDAYILIKMDPEQRLGFIGARDTKQEAKEERKSKEEERKRGQKRKFEEEKDQNEENQRTSWSRLETQLGAEPDSNSALGNNTAEDYRSREGEEVVALYVPKDILTRLPVIQSMVRAGMSPPNLSDVFCSIVTESGGDIRNYSVSADNINKQRSKKLRAAAEERKEDWEPPEYPIITWDEKQMVRGKNKQIRMPILVHGDARTAHQLGSFPIANGKAITVAAVVVSECDDWGIGVAEEEEGNDGLDEGDDERVDSQGAAEAQGRGEEERSGRPDGGNQGAVEAQGREEEEVSGGQDGENEDADKGEDEARGEGAEGEHGEVEAGN